MDHGGKLKVLYGWGLLIHESLIQVGTPFPPVLLFSTFGGLDHNSNQTYDHENMDHRQVLCHHISEKELICIRCSDTNISHNLQRPMNTNFFEQ